MLIEDFFSFSYYLHTNKRELPRKIQSHSNVTWDEIKYLQTFKKEEFRKYLNMSDISGFSLSNNEKEFVKEVMDIIISEVQDRTNRITKFYNDYNRVYNKYKHKFTAHLGTHSLEDNVVKLRIFVRDEYKKERVIHKATYVLPTDIKTVEYYESIKDDVSKVFLTLLESYVHSIQNCGRPFLIPDGFFLTQNMKVRWLEIVKKINLVTGIQPLNLKINVKNTVKQMMLQGLSKSHIFVTDKDILDHPENSLIVDSQ